MPPKKRGATYHFDFRQGGQVLRPNHFDTHWFPMIIPLPNICKSKEFVVSGPVIQVEVGEDSGGCTEEGVGIESEPQVQPGKARRPGRQDRYSLAIRGCQKLGNERCGVCTMRNVLSSLLASAEDKDAEDIFHPDIWPEIDDRN